MRLYHCKSIIVREIRISMFLSSWHPVHVDNRFLHIENNSSTKNSYLICKKSIERQARVLLVEKVLRA